MTDRKARNIINARIRRVSGGNFGNTKSVGDNVSELIIDFGTGYRVYFTQRSRKIILLLCGGDKSTQSRDIEEAKKLAKNIAEV
ncbi:MAG: type II toxin-antitoxin system RelE/ParE family toxin [Treponema sp.]|nr:type II toxin-antitoxin system RelE/ParE family toxin [Treponema sp.]